MKRPPHAARKPICHIAHFLALRPARAASACRMQRHPVHRDESPEPDWANARPLRAFAFPWEDRPAPFTEFRALWNDTRLHFRFECEDADLVLADGATPAERALGSDRVEIFLTPDLSLRPYFCFEMDPRGNVLQYRASFHRQFDRDWSCPGLEIHTSLEAARYSVTGSLLMADLRAWQVLKPGSSEILAGIHRAEFSHRADGGIHPGWMTWAAPLSEKPDFHIPSAFGILELV